MDETLPKYSHNLSRDLTVRLSPLPLSIRVTFSRLLGHSGQKQVYFSDLSSKLSKPYIIVYTHGNRISDLLFQIPCNLLFEFIINLNRELGYLH